MNPLQAPFKMQPSLVLPDFCAALNRATRTLVVVDVVESVRLMQADEAGTIDRWRRFTAQVRNEVLPAHQGRLVKSLGDGLLLEFEHVPAALAAALTIQRCVPPYNAGRSVESAMQLRLGVHVAEVVVDDLDVYGTGVNLAARLAGLAGPGEIVVSAAVRDCLTDQIDVAITDLGLRFLKHFAEAVRAYKVCSTDRTSDLASSTSSFSKTRPVIAILPFSEVFTDCNTAVLGDAIADDVIAALSPWTNVSVISKLSTTGFRKNALRLTEIHSLLGANYVLSGSYRVRRGKAIVRAELCRAPSGEVIWGDVLATRVLDIFHGADRLVPTLASQVAKAVTNAELDRAKTLPISTLEGYTLYVSSLMMLHRLCRDDFLKARAFIEHLSYCHPRSALPYAMLSKWHVLNMLQGWATDPQMEGFKAQSSARRAIDLDPSNAFALSMDALVMAHLGQDLHLARERGMEATRANPQEPNAWLALGGIHSYLGEATQAEEMPLRAVALSPLDPARFLFDVFVAAGKLTAGKYAEAANAARSSIRQNAMHPASHRLLTTALVLDNRVEEARQAAHGLLRVDPHFRVSTHARNHAGRHGPHAQLRADALLKAGLPA